MKPQPSLRLAAGSGMSAWLGNAAFSHAIFITLKSPISAYKIATWFLSMHGRRLYPLPQCGSLFKIARSSVTKLSPANIQHFTWLWCLAWSVYSYTFDAWDIWLAIGNVDHIPSIKISLCCTWTPELTQDISDYICFSVQITKSSTKKSSLDDTNLSSKGQIKKDAKGIW